MATNGPESWTLTQEDLRRMRWRFGFTGGGGGGVTRLGGERNQSVLNRIGRKLRLRRTPFVTRTRGNYEHSIRGGIRFERTDGNNGRMKP